MNIHLSLKLRSLLTTFSLGFFALFLLTGCGKKASDATTAEANGYICTKCNFKFYTEATVLAEHCPSCKEPNIRAIEAFVCERDGHCTLTQKVKIVLCEKCQAIATSRRFPTEAELLSWGAIKKNKSEVSGH